MNSVNNFELNYKKPSTVEKIGGAVAGLAIATSVSQVRKKTISKTCIKKVQNINKSLSADEVVQVRKTSLAALENSGLAKKGVSFVKATKENAEEISDLLMQSFRKCKLFKILPEKHFEKFIAKKAAILQNGTNAAFLPKVNKMIVSDSIATALFHEMGHALNANISKLGKVLKAGRRLSILALPIALIGLLKNKKAPSEKPEGAVDKTTTFIKNNVGKLTLLALLPKTLEEGLASINGKKLAKDLAPELLEKVAKTHKYSFISYLAVTLVSSVGIFLGVKVRDRVAQPELAK